MKQLQDYEYDELMQIKNGQTIRETALSKALAWAQQQPERPTPEAIVETAEIFTKFMMNQVEDGEGDEDEVKPFRPAAAKEL